MSDMLRQQARQQAQDFLCNDQEYRMGYIEAEKPHPLTRELSQTCQRSMPEGIQLLLQVDFQMAQRAAQTLSGEDYARFADTLRSTLKNGGRVIFSGCGSSGRLSMQLERAWRSAINKLSAKYPAAAPALQEKLERVGNIMTGGDYAVIRAVESFEDCTPLGMEQVRQQHLGPGDLLVGVTATGETTSILGTAVQALEQGAGVYMLICADPTPLPEKMERARRVYTHPGCNVMRLPCGPMALTGSTRMQSSTFEQLAGVVALEGALWDILAQQGIRSAYPGYAQLGKHFADMARQLLGEKPVAMLSDAAAKEQAVYEAGGFVTVFADDYLLDVLTDTTERSPTFMTPPFYSADMTEDPRSWAFAKNPTCDTVTAWERCFLRQPRCFKWTREQYSKVMTPQQMEKLFDISQKALQRYLIGNEPAPERECSPLSCAMWVGADAPDASFYDHACRYVQTSELTLAKAGISLCDTATDLLEHLCIKMMLNALSTAVMAGMGRISGNWMTNLSIANKKLVDRGARIVSDLCGVPYEQALEENFYSRAFCEAQGLLRSPVQESIRRLGIR